MAVDLITLAKYGGPDAVRRRLRPRRGERARSRPSSRAPPCSRPAAPARSTSTRRTPTSRPATASRWRTAPAPRSRTWSSIQFHPTCLFHPQAKTFLITEALRGEGGVLRLRSTATAFMERYHPREVARAARRRRPRDRLRDEADRRRLRAARHHRTTTPAFVASASRTSTRECLRFGIDITHAADPGRARRALHVRRRRHRPRRAHRRSPASAPSASAPDRPARRQPPGVELAARRRWSSAHRAADDAARTSSRCARRPRSPEWDAGAASPRDEAVVITHNWDELRRLMWNYVGIVRTDKRLERAAPPHRAPPRRDPRVLLELQGHARPARAPQPRARRPARSSRARGAAKSRAACTSTPTTRTKTSAGRETLLCAAATAPIPRRNQRGDQRMSLAPRDS